MSLKMKIKTIRFNKTITITTTTTVVQFFFYYYHDLNFSVYRNKNFQKQKQEVFK